MTRQSNLGKVNSLDNIATARCYSRTLKDQAALKESLRSAHRSTMLMEIRHPQSAVSCRVTTLKRPAYYLSMS